MRAILAVLLLVPSLAAANVARDIVTTQKISLSSPARYVYLSTATVTATASGTVVKLIWPHSSSARLVDVIWYQNGAGTSGTSYTGNVLVGATSMLSTLATITLASGADKITDAKGEVALPSGWTRPVIKTTADAIATKGAVLLINTVETGAYSPHPTFMVTLVFEPLL